MTEGAAPTRRQLLASLGAGALGGLAGCSSLLWPGDQDPDQEQVELTIKTVPADDDAIAAAIMSQLRENFSAAGIDTTPEPVAASELYRDVLVDREYDVFVTRTTALREPDTLRRLLHSNFRGESGWQNPFNFSNVTVDDLLDEQLESTGEEREAHLEALLELLAQTAPFTVVTFPMHRNGRRTSLPDTSRSKPNQTIGYVDLLSREPSDGQWDGPLRVGVTGDGFTDDLNPIATGGGRVNPLTELLYDPLVRHVDDEYVPWVAGDLSWDDGGNRMHATVTLREGASWHDGESITADDVTFTVEFLGDTSLGELDNAVPATRYRGRQTAITFVDRIDRRTVEFTFETPDRSIAAHALTLPLLPEHVWRPRAEPVGDHETEARTVDNDDPIGSGLFAFADRSEGEYVTFDVFDEHPLLDAAADRPDVFDGFPQYNGLEFRVAPVQGALPDMLIETDIDVTGTPLSSEIVDQIQGESGVALDRSPWDTMYIIGYNLHHPQLGNPRFRSILSRLIDREYVLEEFLDGYGLAPEGYNELVGLPPSTLPSSEKPSIAEFPGSDGEINVEQVRRLFQSEGYRYDDEDDGRLLE